jgi:hypothetical protein
MNAEDRVRYGAALGILVLWAAVVVFGDHETINAVTPAALGAATFLFAAPLVRHKGKDKNGDD